MTKDGLFARSIITLSMIRSLDVPWMMTCPWCLSIITKERPEQPWRCHVCGWRSDRTPEADSHDH